MDRPSSDGRFFCGETDMKDKKDEILLARVAHACEANYEPQFFDFCDEAMQAKMDGILKKSGEPYGFWGGMPMAGRKMLCVYPGYTAWEDLEWPMMAAVFDADFPLEHRNVLGELMALGITRECLGDIYVGDPQVQIIFHAKIYPFLKQNLTRIKGRVVTTDYLPAQDIKAYEPAFKELDVVAASCRVDGLIGKIWGFSRGDALTAIHQGRLRVNYQPVDKGDFRVKTGDILSLRGKGKAVIGDLAGVTKKGNQRIRVRKYV
jgi:RNA-binding protein YlmH